MNPLPDREDDSLLRSWKEIAAFLGVAQRSAQRWERTAGLPVLRVGSGTKARVFARTSELREWMDAGGAVEERERPSGPPGRRPLLALSILVSALAVLALILIFNGVLFPWFRQPDHWVLEGSRFVVLDSRERVCWEKRFPPLNPRAGAGEGDLALIADVDGCGRPEILFNLFPADLSRTPGTLECYDRRGRLRWSYRHGAARSFAGRSFETEYAGRFIRPVRIGGKPFLIATASHYLWYPAQVALLAPDSGRLIEEYWHPGLIQKCLLHDIDGDGAPEFLFAGINNPGNGLGHPAIGVLKLPFSQARQPRSPGDPFPPLTGGGEFAYALFPTPDVSAATATLPRVIELKADNLGRILVEVAVAPNSGIVYYLDGRLEVLEYRFSDDFVHLHDRLFLQHLLDHRLSERESASLGKVVRFPAAPDGNSPALRRFWQY